MNSILLRLTLWLHKTTVRRLRDEFPAEYRDVIRFGRTLQPGQSRIASIDGYEPQGNDHDFLLDTAYGVNGLLR